MKKLNLLFITFATLTLLSSKLTAEGTFDILFPQLFGSPNAGTEFLLTAHPGLGDSKSNFMKLYIISEFESEVKIIQPSLSSEPFIVKKTERSKVLELNIPQEIAQPYLRKQDGDKDDLMVTQIFKEKGIFLKSDFPVSVYAVSFINGYSEGYLTIPMSSLATKYIISGYQETAVTTEFSNTPYASIVAGYDNTLVYFQIGGNDFTKIKTIDGREWKPYEVLRAELNKGDIWLIASFSSYGDLGGSKITSSQPIAVFSGNACAKVPSSGIECNYLIEQEIPQNIWGYKYFAIPVENRRRSSFVRLFAKEPNTNIWQNSKQIAHLDSNYGISKIGWTELRIHPDSNYASCFLSDKPIYAVQFNPSRSDDSIDSSPFQMILISEDQFSKDFTFTIPTADSPNYFSKNYLNLIYRTDSTGNIPSDLEFGLVTSDSTVNWKKVKDFGSDLGYFIDDPEYATSSIKTYSKNIQLSENGKYRLKSKSQPIGAYLYGFSKNGSYAFPASTNLFDNEKYDIEPPVIKYELDCSGNTLAARTNAQDTPADDTTRSNMAFCSLVPSMSYNYIFRTEPFIPGIDKTVKWSLKTIDPNKDAKAVMIFSDKCGNYTQKEIIYESSLITIIPETLDFGTFKTGEIQSIKLTLRNDSKTKIIRLNELNLQSMNENLEESGFSLDYEFNFDEDLRPGDTREMLVTFRATKTGFFSDSIGVGDDCRFGYKSYVFANVISDQIKIFVTDIDFGSIKAGSITGKTASIFNEGTEDLIITGYSLTSDMYSVDLPNLSPKNPIIIKRSESFEFNVFFRSLKEGKFYDTLRFISNAGSNYDPNCALFANVSGVDKYIMILKPLKPISLIAGESLELEWKTSEVFPVHIDLYENKSKLQNIAIYQLPLTYSWKIPYGLPAGKNYKIRIFASYYSEVYAETPILDLNSIFHQPEDPNIIIAPNPSYGKMIIETKNDEIISVLQLYDLTGNMLFEAVQINSEYYIVDLTAIQNGKYFLRINTNRGNKLKSVIIQK